ncbi:hypothetical protein HHI36_006280, partial [Cryptolaemus montrouzieri]
NIKVILKYSDDSKNLCFKSAPKQVLIHLGKKSLNTSKEAVYEHLCKTFSRKDFDVEPCPIRVTPKCKKKDTLINSESKKQIKTTNISNLNVRSMTNKLDIVNYTVDTLNCDIFCVTEHWLNDETKNNKLVPDFKNISCFARKQKSGGGSLRMGNVDCFVALIDAALNKISNESFQHILVAGDINADFLKDSKEKVKIENLMESYGLHTEKLRMTDWLQITQYEDAEQCYDEFHEILHSHFESCFPVKEIKINKMKPRPIWNNAEIKNIKHKLEAAEIIMRVKKDENSTELYKHLKNAFKESIESSVREQDAKYLKKATNKSKAIWEVINSKVKYNSTKDENKSILAPEDSN